MTQAIINNKIKFKFFDKTFKLSNSFYQTNRCEDPSQLKMLSQNQKAIIDVFEAEHLIILKQIHGNNVIDGDLISNYTHEPEADGVVVSKPGVVIAIQTADCVPVLLATNDGKVIAGAHCGWRSALADILEKVFQLMRQKSTANISAIIGPAIHQQSYEVDQDFYDRFIMADPKVNRFFINSPKPKHHLFDLPGFVNMKLADLGINNIINNCENTYTNPDKYYSYRRDMHLNIAHEKNRLLSTMAIEK